MPKRGIAGSYRNSILDFLRTDQVFYKSYNKAVSDDCKSALFYSVKCSVSSDSACVFMGSVPPD